MCGLCFKSGLYCGQQGNRLERADKRSQWRSQRFLNGYCEQSLSALRDETCRVQNKSIYGIPSAFNAWRASAKSAPCRDVRKPVTFSTRTMGGLRVPMPSSTRMNPQKADDCLPERPFLALASDKSLHGKEAVAKVATSGTSA
jgi:hypothetical protein